MMKSENIKVEKLLQQIKIPPAPEILRDLNVAIQKDEPDLSEITKIIQKDTGISGLVIKTVNSPLFGLRNKVNSIRQAVTLLGITYTANIVMGLMLRQTFEEKGENLPRYWESPSNIALVSASLARRLFNSTADEAYLLALFHNSGHALIQQRNKDYVSFYQQYINHPEQAITHFENQQYDFDHATLGYYLAASWDVPKNFQNIILNHHNAVEFLESDSDEVDNNDKDLMAVLKVAEHIDKFHAGVDIDFEWQRVERAVLEHLGLSEYDFEDLRADKLEKLDAQLD